MIALLASLAVAAPVSRTGDVAILSEGLVDRFEVLAVSDAGLVAYKVVSHGGYRGEDDASHPCAYAGMDDPRAAVTLGLYDAAADKLVSRWDVYGLAWGADDCTPRAVSEERLAAAKARFAAEGLDISTPLTSILPTGGKFAVPHAGGAVTFEIAEPASLPEPDDDMMRTVGLALRVGDEARYTRVVTYDVAGAGSYTVTFPAMVAGDGWAMVLEVHNWLHMRGSGAWCTFSPRLSLP